MEDTLEVKLQVSNNDLKTPHPVGSAIQRRLGSNYYINYSNQICEQKEEDWIPVFTVDLPEKAQSKIVNRIAFSVEIPERFLA